MTTTIEIQNLKCGGCAFTIKTKLTQLENISEVEINSQTSQVSFNCKNDADIEAVMQKLKMLGYPSVSDNNSLISKAKSFVSCATGRLSN